VVTIGTWDGGWALYEGVRIPGALRRRLERVLRVEVAERERYRAQAAGFLARRLHQPANEREKLLRAYYADAIDVSTLRREQVRINTEVAVAESKLATDGEKLAQAKADHRSRPGPGEGLRREQSEGEARRPRDVEPGLLPHDPRRRRTGQDFTYEEPFASLIGSHKGSMVEVGGIEPPSPGDRSGLLRAQPAEDLASRLPPAERLSASPGEVSGGGPRAEPLP
jgi:hypothetical protein